MEDFGLKPDFTLSWSGQALHELERRHHDMSGAVLIGTLDS